MNDRQLERYSRHLLLPQVDAAGQQRLMDASALIVGAGGLGSPAAMYLASSGIGRLIINDADRVDLSNLQRQIIHSEADLGRLKVESAAETLEGLNPDVTVHTLDRRLEGEDLLEQVRRADVVLDASDNFSTRFALNAACVAGRVPLVSGAVIRLEGQATVFRNDLADNPCLRCLYPDDAQLESTETCAEGGILAPVAGIIGSIMATESLKVLIGFGETLAGRLLRLDAAAMDWSISRLRRDPSCPVCARVRPAGSPVRAAHPAR